MSPLEDRVLVMTIVVSVMTLVWINLLVRRTR